MSREGLRLLRYVLVALVVFGLAYVNDNSPAVRGYFTIGCSPQSWDVCAP